MTVILFSALILKVIDFLRLLANIGDPQSRSGVVTQLAAWIGGIAIVGLGAHASVASGIILPGLEQTLAQLDAASVILVGLLASSLASTVVDIKQALDGSDSAAKPSLLG